jgi:pyruvate-formate lyase-activating enzyme
LAYSDKKYVIGRRITMKWVEIITLRSPSNINTQFVDELLKEISKPETPEDLVEIRIYHHSVVETDLSIHIYWESEPRSQHKSPLGLKFSYALRNLGLLNHSVWVETGALTTHGSEVLHANQ